MSDIDVWSVARSIYNSVFSTGGVTGCTAAGMEDACLATGSKPLYDSVIGPEPYSDYPYTDPDRGPVTWRITGIRQCDDSIAGIDISANYGNVEIVTADDGSLTAIVTYSYDENVNPIVVTITGENGIEEQIDLYGPSAATPDDPPDTCGDYTSPTIAAGHDIDVAPSTTVDAGTQITLTFPVSAIAECDSTTDSLEVYFIIDGTEFLAAKDGDYYYAIINMNEPGNYPFALIARDTFRSTETSFPYSYDPSYVITVNELGGGTCYSIPDYLYDRSPSPGEMSTMVKGDGTEFIWTISHLQDCNIELLNWINDNIADKLYAPSDVDPGDGPEIAYEIINEGEPDEMGVMTVRGRIRPDVDIATMLIDMDDAYSESPAISVGLYGPNISAPQISLDPWPMVGAEGTYEIQEVNDATNYTIWVTDPGDTDSSMQSGLGRTYAFTPSVTGWHTIHVEVTPYTGDLAHVETYEQTFYVNP